MTGDLNVFPCGGQVYWSKVVTKIEYIVLCVVGLFRETPLCTADRTMVHRFFLTSNFVNNAQQGTFLMSGDIDLFHRTRFKSTLTTSVSWYCTMPLTTMPILLQLSALYSFCFLILSLCQIATVYASVLLINLLNYRLTVVCLVAGNVKIFSSIPTLWLWEDWFGRAWWCHSEVDLCPFKYKMSLFSIISSYLTIG